MRLSVAEREALRKRVEKLVPQMTKSAIVKHFAKEGIARSTIYDTIDRLESSQPISDKKRTGRPSSWTPAAKQKLKRLVNNRSGVSQRRLANQFAVGHRTIGRQISKMGISYRKREKTPKYSEEQRLRSTKLSGKLANNLYRTACSVVMDDEKYFTYAGDNMPGNAGYYTADKSTCPDEVRFAGKEKFPKKLLMWIAISDRGLSEPLFRPSKSVAINSAIYIDECLEKRLLPFIHKYHPDFNYAFWPDLASAHYSKATQDWMEQNVNFVAKTANPPNVPQARPVENFWGCLVQKVYEGGWQATTEDQLIRRIKLKLKDFDRKSVETLMAGVKAKLKSIGQGGVFSLSK
jgi:transposase